MKAHAVSRKLLSAMLLSFGAMISGCDPGNAPVDGQNALKFGSLRIMNFGECGVPRDAYIFQDGSRDTVIVRSIQYGVGSVYANNLKPGVYNVWITPANLFHIDSRAQVTVHADSRKTVILWDDKRLEEQADQTGLLASADSVYVRFLNTKSVAGVMRVGLNNPLDAPVWDTVSPRRLTEYKALRHAIDTSYAIYITKPHGVGGGEYEIVSRLAGATFSPGNFYTIVYGGPDANCGVSGPEGDTLRIRYFDDNEAGNDLTVPPPQSLRFNFVNGFLSPTNPIPGQRTFTSAGLVVNNDNRYLASPLFPKQVTPIRKDVPVEDPNVIPTGFFTLPWTDAILVSMYKVDGLAGEQRGIKMVDALVGTQEDHPVRSDEPFSIIVMDTVSSKPTPEAPLINARGVATLAVPLPSVGSADSVTLVLVNALAPIFMSGQPKSAQTATKFTVNGVVPPVFTNPQPHKTFTRMTLHAPAGKLLVNVTADIGRSTVVKSVQKDFTATAGGIYEIVFVGQQRETSRTNEPELLILRTNP